MPDASSPLVDTGITVGGALTMARQMPDLQMVAAPLFAKGQLITLTGHPGHGKTTFIAGAFVHLGLGYPFGLIHLMTEGIFYFVSVEDFQGSRNRFLAEAARLRLDDAERRTLDVALRWMHVESNVGAQAIRDAIAADASGLDIAAIFVDTGPALFCGADENDNVALRNFVESFKCMADLRGSPATILAWHPSKGATSDRLEPRGASAIKATIDSNLTIWREDDRITISYTKIRGSHFEPIEGRLSEVELVSASDTIFRAPVVTFDNAQAERGEATEIREGILLRIHSAPSAPSLGDIAKALNRGKSTIHRHLAHLANSKPPMVRKDAVDDRYHLTAAGTARAKAATTRARNEYESVRG